MGTALLIGIFVFTLLVPVPAHGIDLAEMRKDGWDEIPEVELTSTEPLVDKESHVEYLYRSIEVNDDQQLHTDFDYHYRLKVFTQAGVDKLAKIDIPYASNFLLRRLKARIIYPDGTIKRLEKSDFFKREIFEDGIFKGYGMSFSFPGLTPSCIIEYKWRIKRRFWLPSLELPLLAEWPTWDFNLVVDPFPALASRIRGYNGYFKFENDHGTFILNKKYLPKSYEGEYLPPRKDFEPWVHMGYATELRNMDPDKYWGYRGGYIADVNKDAVAPKQRAVRELAEELFSGLDSPEDKLRAAYDYCTSRIINISAYTDEFTEKEIEDLKENTSPKQTIKRGYGTRMNINGLFASLAVNAGYEAWLAMVEDRSDHSFNYTHVGYFCLSGWLVAVKDGDDWRYFDPGSSYLPFESLNPENVHARTIVADRKLYHWDETPPADIEDSKRLRRANLSLNDLGDLSGKVIIRYSGYEALWRRRMFAEMSNQEIEDYLNDEIWNPRCPRAKVDQVEIEDLEKRDEPLKVSYSISIPGYAEQAGNRFLLNPALFEKGKSQFLDEKAPRVQVRFSHSFIESDEVSIQLPEGFSLETTEFQSVGLRGKVLNRNSKILWEEDTRTVRFLRRLALSTEAFDQVISLGGQYMRQKGPEFQIVKLEFTELNRIDSQELILLSE